MDVTQPEWLEQVKGVLENLNQGVIINDSSNRILFANSIFLQMIGLAADQLLGRVVTDLFPPEDIQPLLKHIERRQVEGQSLYEFYLPQTGGRRLPVLVTSRQIKHIDGQVFAVVTATDISAQKRAEAELRQANERLQKRHREMEAELLLAARVQQSLTPSSLSWGRVSVEYLGATMGSSREARCAGKYPANTAAATITSAAPAMVSGSFGLSPNSRVEIRRVASSAAITPSAIPTATRTRVSRRTMPRIPLQRHADADLARAPCDREDHHAIHADAAEHER